MGMGSKSQRVWRRCRGGAVHETNQEKEVHGHLKIALSRCYGVHNRASGLSDLSASVDLVMKSQRMLV